MNGDYTQIILWYVVGNVEEKVLGNSEKRKHLQCRKSASEQEMAPVRSWPSAGLCRTDAAILAF